MIRLTYSNRPESLLDALAEALSGRDPFVTAELVVPNRNTEAWLRLGLARSTGIAANLRARFLRRFATEVAEASRPGLRIVDAAALEALLIDRLHDEVLLADEALAAVRGYLAAGGSGRDALDRRRFQLAHELARLYDEYGLSRPELLEAWRAGRTLLGSEVEAWQRRLWRAIDDGEREPLVLAWRALKPAELALPKAVHVFGLPYVARGFHQILAKLGAATELHVYTLNPCREFWEDVARRSSGDDPFGLDRPGDTLALRLWGRPARENIRLLNELTDCDFDDRFIVPAGRTLLERLQREILEREPERAPASINDADASLQLFACPGVTRELEVVASEIWRLVDEHELKLNEIAVVVPPSGQERYQTHLGAVFREMHELPHNVIDLKLTGESRLVEAILLLLQLPFGDFGRQDVLKLMVHPSVRARFPDAPADDWMRWCDALGIVHGADHEDHRGTYIDGDILNWDQGCRRLALGAFLSADAAVELDGRRYLPEEVPGGQLASAGAFQLLARSLIADARFAREARLPLREWVAFLRALVSSYVIPVGDDERQVLDRCLGELGELASRPLGTRPVSYRIAYELATHALGQLAAQRGQYLADGVVVSSFLPMRAIPFRAVFIVGLGEGCFPAPSDAARNQLDLRLAERKAGDVSAREQDKYMFLETLLCTRERLYLSYVSRDPLTGEPRRASSVLAELDEILRGHLGPDALARLKRDFPLRRHEDAHTRAASPAAEREARSRALGEDARAALGRAPTLADAQHEPRLVELLALHPLPDRAQSGPATVKLSFAALRRFLECPLQGSARYLLGLRAAEDDDDDALLREDERFETPRVDALPLLREVFLRALAERGPGLDERALAAALAERAAREQLRGAMPAGPFAEAERQTHVAVLSSWLSAMRAAAGASGEARTYRFGQAEERADVDQLAPPLSLDVELPDGPVRVELHGKTDAILPSVPASLVLQARRRDPGPDKRIKDELRGFFDHAVLAATGQLAADKWDVVVAAGRDQPPDRMPFTALTRDEARAWLATLARDLLSGVHDYLLPIEAVTKSRAAGRTKGKPQSIQRTVDGLRENPRPSYSSLYGPIHRPERFDPPDEADAQAMIARRFGPFFAHRPGDAS